MKLPSNGTTRSTTYGTISTWRVSDIQDNASTPPCRWRSLEASSSNGKTVRRHSVITATDPIGPSLASAAKPLDAIWRTARYGWRSRVVNREGIVDII